VRTLPVGLEEKLQTAILDKKKKRNKEMKWNSKTKTKRNTKNNTLTMTGV
jgi:hypothetical protein